MLFGVAMMAAVFVVLVVALNKAKGPGTIPRFGGLYLRNSSPRATANGGELHAAGESAAGAGWFADPAHRYGSATGTERSGRGGSPTAPMSKSMTVTRRPQQLRNGRSADRFR